MTVPFATLAGGALVLDWEITHQRLFTFEAELPALEAVCPPSLAAIEVRPGVGLLSVGLVRMRGGDVSPDETAMDELFTVIHVAPDLSLAMPNAKFSFFIHSVWSNSAAFVRADLEHISAPVIHDPSLSVAFDEEQFTARAETSSGPVVALRFHDRAPTWSHTSFVGQHFTDQAGMRIGAWQWEGERAETMKSGPSGSFVAHAFWRGLDPACIGRCYRQMIKRPGTIARERFYRMHQRGQP